MASMKAKKASKVMATVVVLLVLLVIVSLLDLAWAARMLSAREVIDVLLSRGTWANNLIVKDNAVRIVIGLLDRKSVRRGGSGRGRCGHAGHLP